MSVDIRKVSNNNNYHYEVTLSPIACEDISDSVWTHDVRDLTQEVSTDLSPITSRLDKVPAMADPYEGVTTMNGSEQVMVVSENGVQHYLEGFIDLSNVVLGDTVVIRQYVKIRGNGDYIKRYEQEYSGPFDKPLATFDTRMAKYGIKVTLQQTAGVYRTIPWQFFLVEES